MDAEKKKTLEANQASKLWQQGKEKWNEWADEHEGWEVSFEGVDFSALRDVESSIDFSGYKFPGSVSFSDATFGEGDVSFYDAT